jgi:hypothetical protein
MHADREPTGIRRLTATDRPRSSRRAVAPPGAPTGLGFLNRYLGNHYVQRKCTACQENDEPRRLQRKPSIGPANDVFEQEADCVAQQVTHMAAPTATGLASPPAIRRLPTAASGARPSAAIDPDAGGGRPLSPATRRYMEPRFGADFGTVRLHADARAASAARQLQARAFTYGRHIWLGAGESEHNHPLLAHELTHVLQQGAARTKSATDAAPAGPNAAATPAGARVQRTRLPCTSRTTVGVYAVNLPGSTRTIYNDLAFTNSVLCQCGIEVKVVGGQSWSTNLLDTDPPAGVLNAPSGTVRTLTTEETTMLAHKPGGPDVIHVYYVPSFTGPKLAESFWPSQHGEQAVAVANAAIPVVFPHELGHVLLDDGSHHPNRDNLLATGTVNSGAGELEPGQCARMP